MGHMLTCILVKFRNILKGRLDDHARACLSWKHECPQCTRVFHALEHLEKVAVVPVNDSLGLQHACRHAWRGWDIVDVSFPALPEPSAQADSSLSSSASKYSCTEPSVIRVVSSFLAYTG